AAIARRAHELTKAKVADTNGQEPAQGQPAHVAAPTVPLPEAPVSIMLKATLHGHEVLVTLRGVDFASVRVAQGASSYAATSPGNRAASRLVCQAQRADETKPQGRPLLVVTLDPRGLVQRQVTSTRGREHALPHRLGRR